MRKTKALNNSKIIKYFNNKKNQIKSFHYQMKAIDVDGEIPYVVLRNWVLDIIQYGLVTAFVYYNLVLWKGVFFIIFLPLSLGMVRWLFLKLLEDVIKLFRG